MALRLEDKKVIVAEVAEVASRSLSALAAHYRGLTVTQLNTLRANARKNKIYMRVVPNTLAIRALEDTEFGCLNEALVGPVVLMFSLEDPGSAARLVRDFVKTHEKFEVKALALGGKLLAAQQLEAVAQLPTRDQGISLLMSVMQAPVTKLVRTLVEPYAMLVRTVAAVRDQKQAA
ncbi:MAG: 50S ribosomal protein L10 [Gammaproteobacteria bacterium]|nr:50S ribosomal protein L10 [Gammaproteobacteria bacterium]